MKGISLQKAIMLSAIACLSFCSILIKAEAMDKADFAEMFNMSVDELESIPPIIVEEGAIEFGDVNCDGSVDIVDALMISQYYAGQISKNDIFLINSDVNSDGIIDIIDALLVAQFYVGLNDKLPIDTVSNVFGCGPDQPTGTCGALAHAASEALEMEIGQITYPDLRRIRSLVVECSDNERLDLTRINQMTGLAYLKVSNCELADLSHLSALYNLQRRFPKNPGAPENTYSILTGIDLRGSDIFDYGALMSGGLVHIVELD